MSRLFALLVASVLLAFAASSCARVVKRMPARSQPAAGTSLPAKPDAGLPPGARCLESPQPDTEPEDPACPSDGVLAPPGLCYDDGAQCPGVDDHVALLTFDDGPSDWTHGFLDILADENVHATFFINAHLHPQRELDDSYMDSAGKPVFYRDVLARTVAGGHVLGNHTRDHLDLSTLDADAIHEQLEQNELLVSRALIRAGSTAAPLTLVRPPFGLPWFDADDPLEDAASKRATAAREVARYGVNVLWNLSSTDAQEWAQGEAASMRELAKANDSTVSYQDKV
jgi:peptidoglycan/xylan/chitin deacetylase (PgdA/CDA1 family)